MKKRKKVAKPWYQYYDEPPTDEELEKREKKLNKNWVYKLLSNMVII